MVETYVIDKGKYTCYSNQKGFDVNKSLIFLFCLGIQLADVDPRVRKMYEGVREVLAKYRSGKLPKAFKLLPKVCNWEQLLYITGQFLLFLL